MSQPKFVSQTARDLLTFFLLDAMSSAGIDMSTRVPPPYGHSFPHGYRHSYAQRYGRGPDGRVYLVEVSVYDPPAGGENEDGSEQ